MNEHGPWAGNTSIAAVPGADCLGGAASVVVVVAAAAPPGRHNVWPGWITVAVVAPLAFMRAVIVTFAFVEIRYHESPLITLYVAPGHAGPDGETALAMAVTGTMPMAKTTTAKSQRLRVDGLGACSPLNSSHTDVTATPLVTEVSAGLTTHLRVPGPDSVPICAGNECSSAGWAVNSVHSLRRWSRQSPGWARFWASTSTRRADGCVAASFT